MLGLIVKAPVKIVATFVVSLGLLLGAFIYLPDALTTAQDWSNNVSDAVRDLPPDNKSTVLWRTFTDSNAILAVFVTILSRSIVELAGHAGGAIYRAIRG
jgi:hypothetical protein